MKFRHLAPMAGTQQCLLRALHTQKVFTLWGAGRKRTRTNADERLVPVFVRVEFREW
jgi:hypothetical protein